MRTVTINLQNGRKSIIKASQVHTILASVLKPYESFVRKTKLKSFFIGNLDIGLFASLKFMRSSDIKGIILLSQIFSMNQLI